MSLAKLLFCTLPLLSIAVTFAQTQEPEGQPSLGDVARETREQRRLQPQQESAHAMKVRELIADMSMNTPEDYQEKIRDEESGAQTGEHTTKSGCHLNYIRVGM